MSESRTATPPVTTSPLTPRPSRPVVPLWQFAIPLALQALLIVALPARHAYTVATGTAVVLQTVPVDPYDLLRGYYQTLSYEISQVETLAALPGGTDLFAESRRSRSFEFYLVLEAPPASAVQPPPAWQPVRVSRTLPEDLTKTQVALRGQSRGWRIDYGLERYYLPEAQRDRINASIQTVQRSEPQAFRVAVKIDPTGAAVPASLWVGDRNYRF